MTKLIPALAVMLLAAPAFAQSGATQSPPAPNSASSAPQPANSLPGGTSNLNTGSVSNPNTSGALSTTNTTTGQQTSPVTAPPASGAGDAFSRTVPTPAR